MTGRPRAPRCWACAVITESHRIHRSNLIGTGVLRLQCPNGESTEALRLTGEEPITITDIQALDEGASDRYGGILRQLLDQDTSS